MESVLGGLRYKWRNFPDKSSTSVQVLFSPLKVSEKFSIGSNSALKNSKFSNLTDGACAIMQTYTMA